MFVIFEFQWCQKEFRVEDVNYALYVTDNCRKFTLCHCGMFVIEFLRVIGQLCLCTYKEVHKFIQVVQQLLSSLPIFDDSNITKLNLFN